MSISRVVALAVAIGWSLCAVSATTAQEGRPGGGFRGGPGGSFGGGGGAAGLLRNEQVQQELELVDEQLEKLRGIGEDFGSQMREMFSGLRDLDQDERRARFEELREKMTKMREEVDEQVNDILLPNQRERLQQIALQARVARGGTVDALSGGELAETLGLTEEQIAKLRERQEEVTKELREQTEKLRAEAREKLLEVLTSEQREKLEKMLGESFQFDRGGSAGRGPGGRGPGGFGDRGRGGRGGGEGGRPPRGQRPEAE